MSEAPVLRRRALNRALLARQSLLRRRSTPVAKAVEHLVGLQAQNPQDPYFALWSRVDPFDPQALSALLEQRKAVRISLHRSTLHLVTARDALALRPVVQPVHDRLWRASHYARALAGADLEDIVGAGRKLLEAEPLTNQALGRALRQRWPGRDAPAMGYAVRTFAPLVQVPPRGLWGQGGAPKHTAAENWLGRRLAKHAAPDAMVLRYLAAFGPASARDAQAWSGLTGLQAAFDRLRPRLRAFRDEEGRELLDLPRAPRPRASTPAPPRFLPEYDNVFLGHADRSRIAPPSLLADTSALETGEHRAPFLLDGFVRGMWKLHRDGRAATLRVHPFERLGPRDRAGLGKEGARLLAFAAADASRRTVRFAAAQR